MTLSRSFSMGRAGGRGLRSLLWMVGLGVMPCAYFSSVSSLPAQETSNDSTPTNTPSKAALDERQELIRDRIVRLEDRMFQLAQALKKTEPEKAERLMDGLGRLRGDQVRAQIDEIIKQLKDNRLSDAADQQQLVMGELQSLLKQLMDGPDDLEERQDEIEKLNAIRKSLDDLVREQQRELDAANEARDVAARERAINAAAQKLQELLKRQQEATARTTDSANPGDEEQTQADLRTETEKLAAQLSEMADADAESENVASAAGQLQSATDQMKAAEASLHEGGRESALKSQQSASDAMEKALAELEQESAELRRKLKLEEQAKEQQETANKTRKLAEDMGGDDAAAEKGGEGESSQENSKPSAKKGEATPGQQGVSEAVPQQEGAAEDLQKNDPDKAVKKQEKALENLKKSQEELEDRLEQLRQEQQEEMLAALESRFRAMLSRQLECNKATDRLANLKQANWKRSDELELPDLSQKQRWVGDQADEALFLLTEEGTTIILPQLIKQVRDDAREAADDLAAAKVGDAVLATQADLESVLRDIIEAIERKQEEMENEESGGENEAGQQNSPLLPGSAELKLLRSCQMRVNRLTERLKSDREKPDAPAEEISDRLQKLSQRQSDVAEMARQMHESLRQAQ